MRLLVSEGADIDAKDNNSLTSLQDAALNGHEAVVQLLVKEGANIKAKTEYGRMPLHYAAMNGHEAVVQQLLTTRR